MQGTLAKIKES